MNLNRYIDHTLLNPFAKRQAVEQLCQEAIDYNFYAVCVSPFHTCVAYHLLEAYEIKLATVIGFPYGYDTIKNKLDAVAEALPIVDEFDIVINLQATSDENYDYLRDEITQLTTYAHDNNKLVKWIVESGNIPTSQLAQLCAIANEAKIDFMKTSTGMLGAGASVDSIKFMRSQLDEAIAIKASGGIRDRATALAMIDAGATRIGASRSVDMMMDFNKKST